MISPQPTNKRITKYETNTKTYVGTNRYVHIYLSFAPYSFNFKIFSEFLPSLDILSETCPLLDSENPNLSKATNNDAKLSTPNENLSAPPPTFPSDVSPALTNSSPDLINELLNTIQILRKEKARDQKIIAENAKTKEKDEKIKATLRSENQRLLKEKISAKNELSLAKKALQNIRNGKTSLGQKRSIIREVMGKFGYTQKQLDCFVRGDWVRVKGWQEEDIKFALALRTISRKAYTWIRKKKLIPLPGESNLRKYMRNLRVPPGRHISFHCLQS